MCTYIDRSLPNYPDRVYSDWQCACIAEADKPSVSWQRSLTCSQGTQPVSEKPGDPRYPYVCRVSKDDGTVRAFGWLRTGALWGAGGGRWGKGIEGPAHCGTLGKLWSSPLLRAIQHTHVPHFQQAVLCSLHTLPCMPQIPATLCAKAATGGQMVAAPLRQCLGTLRPRTTWSSCACPRELQQHWY